MRSSGAYLEATAYCAFCFLLLGDQKARLTLETHESIQVALHDVLKIHVERRFFSCFALQNMEVFEDVQILLPYFLEVS